MLRVPSLPEDPSAAEPEIPTPAPSQRPNTDSAYYADIEDRNIDYYNYCDPTVSVNLDDNSCSNDSPTALDSAGSDVFHASPNRACTPAFSQRFLALSSM